VRLHIHIGLPKTAVSTLSYIFENSNKVNFLGRPLIPLYDQIWQSMIFDTEYNFKKILLKLKNNIISSLSQKKENILLIEGITDVFFTLNNNNKVDYIKRLNILKNVLDEKVEIKILYVMRNQSDFFISRYVESSQYFQNYIYKWKDFGKFKETFKKNKIIKKEKIFLNSFKYYHTCKKLINIFGKKNVNFLIFEQLKYDKKEFSKKISKIFKLDKQKIYRSLKSYKLNKSTNLKKNIYIRKKLQLNFILTNNFMYVRLNKKIPRNIKNFFKQSILLIDKIFYILVLKLYPEKKIYTNNNEKLIIKKFYYNDNKKIDKYLKLNLKKYNYYSYNSYINN